jgi:hypothetical protein
MFTDIVGYTALMQTDERVGLDKRGKQRIERLVEMLARGETLHPEARPAGPSS